MTPVSQLDWPRIESELDDRGFALTGQILDAEACGRVAALYADASRFRSRVVMARHGYGRGEYQYFAYPLPEPVQQLRQDIYGLLAPVANRWAERLGQERRFPDGLQDWLARCHAAGQVRPTPLMLAYGAGDYNCLHQDLYGEHVFPLQMAILLDEPVRDFDGGEFVLVEQRPRQQSCAHVVPLSQGHAVIFAVRDRPARGARGVHRRALRHGVAEVRSGRRRTLGIILHDAA